MGDEPSRLFSGIKFVEEATMSDDNGKGHFSVATDSYICEVYPEYLSEKMFNTAYSRLRKRP